MNTPLFVKYFHPGNSYVVQAIDTAFLQSQPKIKVVDFASDLDVTVDNHSHKQVMLKHGCVFVRLSLLAEFADYVEVEPSTSVSTTLEIQISLLSL